MKIVIADELPLFRQSVARLVLSRFPQAEIIEVDSYTQLHQCLEQNISIDYVFMDLHIPGNSGLSGIASLLKRWEDCRLVVISATESPMIVYRTIKLGARGFIPKTSDESEFVAAMTDIFNNKNWIPNELKTRSGNQLSQDNFTNPNCNSNDCLSEKIASLSPRQYKVLEMISDGQLNKQIAYDLELCEGTIKHHVSLILQKLKVVNRTAAANMFNRLKVEKRLNLQGQNNV